MIESVCDYSKCSGCSACMNVCPTGAISMKEGIIGHIYPHISAKCIDCHKCEKICPVNNEVELVEPHKVYAAWISDDEDHKTSASGGAASCFTNKILDECGVVYGCASLPHGVIKHIRITDKSQAHLLKGSKYVHGQIENTYQLIKQDLKDGKRVLFIGLPCQVAGLKNYLDGKSVGLISVDLICHGIPSQKVLFDHLATKGFVRDDIDSIGFREQSGHYLSVKSMGKVAYREPEYKDFYYMAFNDNLCFRDSCFMCRYATPERCGDITIGDFWGLGKKIPFFRNTRGNVSLIIINNDIGANFFNECSGQLEMEERPYEEAILGNPNLHKPSFSKNSEKFRALYGKVDIEEALGKCIWKRRIKAPLQPFVRWLFAMYKKL